MSSTINVSAENSTITGAKPGRRSLLKGAGFSAVALGALTMLRPETAAGQTAAGQTAAIQTNALTDADILNFALNLEYLEAEFYLNAVYGHGLRHSQSTGMGGNPGVVTGGGKMVGFSNKYLFQYAQEIANDELNHVLFLRAALGSAAVARPALNLSTSFTTLARAAGVIGQHETFDPFLNEQNFLLGAFIFEDVGVTAYNGAAAAITSKSYLTAASSILAVEAYHAASIRVQLIQQGLVKPANQISALRAALSSQVAPGTGDDQGLTLNGKLNVVPTDSNSLAFARTPGQVLNIVYGGGSASGYLFFPDKLNGTIS